jgi:D-alanyl-D-alanine carboxypeptidase/D-alanyl-D-alanine-endopeptidase (penicillin-binding protein 4)
MTLVASPKPTRNFSKTLPESVTIKALIFIGLLIANGFCIDSLAIKMHSLHDSLVPQSKLGLSLRSHKTGTEIFSIRGSELFKPASALKLIVTATALDRLGPDYRAQTQFTLHGSLVDSIFTGSLIIKAQGEPNISARYFNDPIQGLHFVADSLLSFGIKKINGKIITDTSWYEGSRKPEGWKDRFFDQWYGAEVSPFAFNDNCIRIIVEPGLKPGDTLSYKFEPALDIYRVINNAKTTSGSRKRLNHSLKPDSNIITITGSLGVNSGTWASTIPVRNPTAYYRSALHQALLDRDILIDTNLVVSDLNFFKSFTIRLTPLLSFLDEINQRSQNLHSEMLLRNLGRLTENAGSASAGLLAEKKFLAKIGLDTSAFILKDASGLSYDNQISPSALSLVLASQVHSPHGYLYINSLATPGISGTRRGRLASIESSDQFRFKTGFINNVQALAGYLFTPLDDTLSLVLFTNGYQVPDDSARNVLDTLWAITARHFSRESQSLQEARTLFRLYTGVDSLQQRLRSFSESLLGRPYLLGPTGEGAGSAVEPKPIINLHEFDCVTYMEHVMALAYAQNEDSILAQLQKIRYRSDTLSYETRNHYFVEDWLKDNANYIKNVNFPMDTVGMRVMDKKSFYSSKGLQWPKANPETNLRYLTYDQALAWSRTSKNPNIYGVGFIGNSKNIWVTHTGFVLTNDTGSAVLRHASSLGKKVLDQSLEDYLISRKGKCQGIVLFEFKDKP